MIISNSIGHVAAKILFCSLLLMPSDTTRKVNNEVSVNPRISNQTLEQKTRFISENFDSLEIEINKCMAKKELNETKKKQK